MAGHINQGKDFNFFQKLTVTGSSYSSDADVVFNFRGQQGFYIVNYGPGTVEVSYNGNTTHGELAYNTPSASQHFDNRRVSRMWFKLTSGGSAVIAVQGWGAK